MVDRSKALVSRAALERVLARAAQLQGASGNDGEAADTLTEAQVEELAKEVGLSPEHIRQALAEERAHIQPAKVEGSGLAFQLFGPDVTETQRVIRGKPERILAALDRWMQKEEGLKVQRQRAEIITWEPMRGVFGSLRRMLGTGDFALTRADQVTATVVPVDEEFTLVRLHAAFGGLRNAMKNRTIGGTTFGALMSGGLLALGSVVPLAADFVLFLYPVAALPVLVAGGGSYYSARQTQQGSLLRAQLAFEQILDRLERGDADRPSLLRMIESALPPAR